MSENPQERIRERIASRIDLPTIPAVALEILRLWDDEAVDIGSISELIAKDAALAAKLIRTANSPFYGFRSQVSSLDRAVTVLGLNATLALSLSFTLVRGWRRKDPRFDHRAFWQRSVLSAAAAQALGRHRQVPNDEELFLAALTQDIGMLVLDAVFPKRYAQMVSAAADDHGRLVDAEENAFGVDHAVVGSWLLESWGFPAQLCTAVAASHDPNSVAARGELATFLHVVSLSGLAADCFTQHAHHAIKSLARAGARPPLEMKSWHLEALLADTGALLPQLGALLEIELVDTDEVDEMLQQARAVLLHLALEGERNTRNLRRKALVAEQNAMKLATENQLLELRASRDGLTGLYNREHADRLLAYQFDMASATGSPLSVLFCDLDRFKEVNDTHGHRVGDQVLIAVADAMSRALRTTDVLSRYGGEEFVVIVGGADEELAWRISERMREVVAEKVSVRSADGESVKVTMSVGCVTHNGHAQFRNAEDMMASADQSLLSAKKSGRNRVMGPLRIA